MDMNLQQADCTVASGAGHRALSDFIAGGQPAGTGIAGYGNRQRSDEPAFCIASTGAVVEVHTRGLWSAF